MTINYKKKIMASLRKNSWDGDFEFEDIMYENKMYFVAITVEDYSSKITGPSKGSWGYHGGEPDEPGYAEVSIKDYSYKVYLNNQDKSWDDMRVNDPILSKAVAEKAFKENKEKMESEMAEKIIEDKSQPDENPFDDRI